ncbi:hypothetical protein ACE0DR_28860 [Azotobacter sp. CWF10]
MDVALDHRAAGFAEQLRAAVPAGIDVYSRTSGASVLDAVLPLLNDFARIPVCGTIATYNNRGVAQPGPDRPPALFSQILRQRLTVRGFIVHDFKHPWPDFEREMAQWLREGRIQYREDVVEGLEKAPEAPWPAAGAQLRQAGGEAGWRAGGCAGRLPVPRRVSRWRPFPGAAVRACATPRA